MLGGEKEDLKERQLIQRLRPGQTNQIRIFPIQDRAEFYFLFYVVLVWLLYLKLFHPFLHFTITLLPESLLLVVPYGPPFHDQAYHRIG